MHCSVQRLTSLSCTGRDVIGIDDAAVVACDIADTAGAPLDGAPACDGGCGVSCGVRSVVVPDDVALDDASPAAAALTAARRGFGFGAC